MASFRSRSSDCTRLVFEATGRQLNYNRLHVTDATGRALAAWMEVAGQSKIQPVLRSSTAEGENPKPKIDHVRTLNAQPSTLNHLIVVVEDAGALYHDASLTFTDTTAPPVTAYYRLVQH